MDQQHLSNLAVGHPGIYTSDGSPHEARGTPAPTVLSEGEWLAVSTEGFSEQQRGRPLEHLVKEPVQNALDSGGDSGRIDLALADVSGPFLEIPQTGKMIGGADRGRLVAGRRSILH